MTPTSYQYDYLAWLQACREWPEIDMRLTEPRHPLENALRTFKWSFSDRARRIIEEDKAQIKREFERSTI